jgi:hypothetical protein
LILPYRFLTQAPMEYTIESHLKQRKLSLLNSILKTYEVEPHIIYQLHKWIEEGVLSERALRRPKAESDVLSDDTPSSPRRS